MLKQPSPPPQSTCQFCSPGAITPNYFSYCFIISFYWFIFKVRYYLLTFHPWKMNIYTLVSSQLLASQIHTSSPIIISMELHYIPVCTFSMYIIVTVQVNSSPSHAMNSDYIFFVVWLFDLVLLMLALIFLLASLFMLSSPIHSQVIWENCNLNLLYQILNTYSFLHKLCDDVSLCEALNRPFHSDFSFFIYGNSSCIVLCNFLFTFSVFSFC